MVVDSTNSGVVITLETKEFERLLNQADKPLVVHQEPRWYSPQHRYLFSFRGMTFFTRSKSALRISKYADVVTAKGFHVHAVA
jgi:hypothetical protein